MVRVARALLRSASSFSDFAAAKEHAASGIGNVAALKEHLLPSVAKLSDQVVSHGKGSYVWTTEGQKLLDFAGAIGVLSTGHCHPRVVAALQQQAGRLILPGQNIFAASKPLFELVERLLEVCPPHLSRFFFCSSGSEAVDNAIKISRAATGKQNIISFMGGYHGRTYGSMAVTTSKTIYRQLYGPVMPGVHVAPYPYCLQCNVRKAWQTSDYPLAPPVPPLAPEGWTCCGAWERGLDALLAQASHPDETAALLVEPVLGEGGFLTPPPGFLDALRRLADKHRMLLIMDEVQSGVGRTGRWWAHQHFGDSRPDILIFAKGIASGLPFAGLATRPDLYERMQPGSMGGTYGAGALGCAAAAATLDVIREESLLSNAEERGLQLHRGLLAVAAGGGAPIIDVRGKGLMAAVEFGGRDGGHDAVPGTASKVVAAARAEGLILMSAGAREAVRFLPPLNVSAPEVDEALAKFEAACRAAFKA